MSKVNFILQRTKSYQAVQEDIYGEIEQHLEVPPTYVAEDDLEALVECKNSNKLTLFARCRAGNILMSHGVADKNYLFMKDKATKAPFVNGFDHVLVPGDWLKNRLLASPCNRLSPEQIHIVGWPRLDRLLAERERVKKPRDPKNIRLLWAPTHDKRKRGEENESTSSYPALDEYSKDLSKKFSYDIALHPRNRENKTPTAELLVQADVVISDFGTMVYEAWGLGIPVIFPRWILKDRVIKYTEGSAEAFIFENNIGLHANSYEELCEMAANETELGDDVKGFMKEYLPSRFLGKSAKAIAELLAHLVPAKPKEVLLHIGSYKTGSSFIQNTIIENQDVLRENDVEYPSTGLTKSKSKGRRHHFLCKAIEAQDEELFHRLQQEIRSTSCSNIIISAERFSRLNREQIEFLRLRLFGYNVKVLFTVRRQDQLFESLYAEYVQNNALTNTPSEYLDRDQCLLAFDDITERWMDAFGADNVDVVGFEEMKAKGLVKSILAPLGKEHVADQLESTKSSNPSLSADDTQLKLNLNIASRREKGKKKLQKLKSIGDAMAAQKDGKSNRRLSLFGLTERREFVQSYRASSERLFKLIGREIPELINIEDAHQPDYKTDIHVDRGLVDLMEILLRK